MLDFISLTFGSSHRLDDGGVGLDVIDDGSFEPWVHQMVALLVDGVLHAGHLVELDRSVTSVHYNHVFKGKPNEFNES